MHDNEDEGAFEPIPLLFTVCQHDSHGAVSFAPCDAIPNPSHAERIGAAVAEGFRIYASGSGGPCHFVGSITVTVHLKKDCGYTPADLSSNTGGWAKIALAHPYRPPDDHD